MHQHQIRKTSRRTPRIVSMVINPPKSLSQPDYLRLEKSLRPTPSQLSPKDTRIHRP
nr:MAG TPA: hypothetical protein [Caudoviricetes sp.]